MAFLDAWQNSAAQQKRRAEKHDNPLLSEISYTWVSKKPPLEFAQSMENGSKYVTQNALRPCYQFHVAMYAYTAYECTVIANIHEQDNM